MRCNRKEKKKNKGKGMGNTNLTKGSSFICLLLMQPKSASLQNLFHK